MNGYIVVEDQHGYIRRQLMRRYALPEGCRVESVESKLSSDGVLSIIAPRQSQAVKDERPISIQQTGSIRKEIKDHVPQEIKEKRNKQCNI